MSTIDEYRGNRIVIRNNGTRCIHSRYCVLGRPDVFVPNVAGPWIQPDAAAADTVAAQIALCPSGALLYERIDGGAQEKPPGVNTVRAWENGPLAFHAELEIAGETTSFRATLCRCGQSKSKPYCDHSHVETGFTATGEPASKPSEPLARRDGPLKVTLRENGPLVVEGSLEICSASGRTVSRETRTVLCRCGSSANKPFCDGTHKKIGFIAPALSS
jgi:CDGSH-type Zn-finger protein/uncharacterized Fe-S cluster protein YjdI